MSVRRLKLSTVLCFALSVLQQAGRNPSRKTVEKYWTERRRRCIIMLSLGTTSCTFVGIPYVDDDCMGGIQNTLYMYVSESAIF